MKKYSIIFTLVISMLVFAGCSQTASTNQDVIKIGVNYELSGGVATYGQSSVEGIELAVEQINQAGGINGKKIQLVKYDNKSEPSEATTLATRLMTQDKVVAILGPATSGAFMATIPVANQNKVPVISGSATADNVTVDDKGVKEYAFRICFTDSQQGSAAAKFALENLSTKKAVIIMDSSSDYAKGLAETFTSTFEAGGGTVVAQEAYMAGDTDFNAVLTSIKGKDFDVIFIPGYYNEAGLIIKQARAQGIDVPILGADGFDSPKLAELAGAQALNKVYFTNHYSSVDSSPVVAEFVKAFKAKYNKEPDAFNALGYDLAKFVADALSRAEKIDGESLKKALEATKDFKGVTGTMSVDENHNVVKDIIVIELKDGKQYKTYRVTN
ncbi:ABC transporter substrate-binding protein [Caldicoprobacter algeriensis]|uniref:ABC transporter substrate-binding protein n=1 Tax=Caldicoprobacter algeriensis TaxID=699281 RepID=UPI00207A85CA|nr:ABC transporter substrate-binding protein [Caldicoprobacter algeriensis]MCM8901142.1 ABC transporter substrate-binding protein [Caldicoprobacter algeriensis]